MEDKEEECYQKKIFNASKNSLHDKSKENLKIL